MDVVVIGKVPWRKVLVRWRIVVTLTAGMKTDLGQCQQTQQIYVQEC